MKQDKITIKFFLDRGYTENADGSFSPPSIKKGFIGKKKGFEQSLMKADTVIEIDENVSISPPKASVLTIHGLVAGLNGSHGLMQSHWSNNKKQKDLYQKIIGQHLAENKIRKHTGEVTIEYIGYKSRFMDWDNFCASFKLVGDSLCKMGIILDDNPKIVTQFIPNQIKVPRTEHKVVIIIKDK